MIEPVAAHLGSAKVRSDAVCCLRARPPQISARYVGHTRKEKADAKKLEQLLLACCWAALLDELDVC